jgi:hypothetical protein
MCDIFRNFARFLWHLMKNEFKQQNNDNEKIYFIFFVARCKHVRTGTRE